MCILDVTTFMQKKKKKCHPHLVGRHEIMAGLHQVGEDVRHLSLLRGHVPLEMAVERQQEQAVRSNHPRDEVHHQEFHLLVGTG